MNLMRRTILNLPLASALAAWGQAEPPGTEKCTVVKHRGPVTKAVLFDVTTVLAPSTVHELVERLQRAPFLEDRDRLRISQFGGTSPNLVEDLLDVTGSDADLDRLRWTVSPRELKRLESCQTFQKALVRDTLRAAAAKRDDRQGLSPIFEALAAAFPPGREPPRTLCLVSDGIQNSNFTFYSNGDNIRMPESRALVSMLRERALLPALRGTTVLHVGFGLTADVSRGPRLIRDPDQTRALKAAWSAVWDAVGARAEFGEPLPSNGLV